jgi:hypothetical protein
MALPQSGDEGEEEVGEEKDSDDELQPTGQTTSKRLVYNTYHKSLALTSVSQCEGRSVEKR